MELVFNVKGFSYDKLKEVKGSEWRKFIGYCKNKENGVSTPEKVICPRKIFAFHQATNCGVIPSVNVAIRRGYCRLEFTL
ncbi:hypothetical protein [Bacteroides sp. 14(A)]|uniref:hypothetical protein n=1 Tax=Bacteroides sp. 14(A) TaxID=1163670 RepID=UPI0009DEBFA3|nr:hypothetical protein [Bacteroides sp. 14(A)]